MSRRLTRAHAHATAARLLAASAARYGTATMTAPPQQQGQQQGQNGQGQQGGGQSTAAGGTGEESPPAAATTGQQPNGGGQQPQFTQADLDRIIGERIAAEKAKHDQALKDAQALAGKNETEKLTIERDQAAKRAQDVVTQSAQRIARTEAKGIARDLDARPDRLDAILRQADLSKAVKDDGDVDEAAVKAAVEKVLADYPEWKKTAGGATASGGELNGGGGGGKPTFTRKQLEEMPPEEMARRIDEVNEAIADGRVTG